MIVKLHWRRDRPGPAGPSATSTCPRRKVGNPAHWPVVLLLVFLFAFPVRPIHAEKPAGVALTAEERAWLDRHPDKLTLYFNVEFPPIEFASTDGRFAGLGADVIAMVEERLGVVFLKSPSDDWNQHLAALESGECAIAPTIVRTDERERFAFFTAPYATVPVVIITARGEQTDLTLDDFAGQRVAVVSGYATESYLQRHADKGFVAIPMPDVAHGLRAVSFGQVDAFVENLAVAAYHIDQEGIPNLRVAGKTDYSFAFCIGVSRHYPLLFSAIQKALAAIPPGQRQTAEKRWISLQMGSTISAGMLRLAKIIAIMCALLLLGLSGLNFLLKRRLREKVANLQKTQQRLMDQTERLQLATEAIQAGIWESRPEARTIYLSPQWHAMLGYPPEEKTVPLEVHLSGVHPEDRPTLVRFFEDYIRSDGQARYETELRIRRADGTWCWLLSKGKAVEWNDRGLPTRITGLDVNIQSTKAAQIKTAQSEAKFRAIFDHAPYAIAINNFEDGTLIDANPAYLDSRGLGKAELGTTRPRDYTLITDDAVDALLQTLASEGSLKNVEATILNRDGTPAHIIYSAVLLELEGRRQILSITVDVTERRQKEVALRENMELLRATFNATPDGILVVNNALKVIQANRQFYELWNIPPEIQKTDDDATLRKFVRDQLADPAGFESMVDRLYHSGVQNIYEIPFRDGRVFECYSAPMIMDGNEIGRVWDFRDITERKRAEEALRSSENKLRSLFAAMTDIILILDAHGRYLEIAPTSTALLYRPPEQLLGKAIVDIFPPDQADLFLKAIQSALSDAKSVSLDYELTIGNRHIWFAATISALAADRVIWVARDITKRKRAEEMLRQSEEKFSKVFMMAPDLIVITRLADGLFVDANLGSEGITGWKRSEIIGKRSIDLNFWVDPSARTRMVETLKAGKDVSHREIQFRRKDQALRIGIYSARMINIADDSYLIFVMQDITESRHMEEEHRKLEQQLLQSQKLEAVGILAGGVAHDFNNMLGAIMGYAELALIGMDATDPMYENFNKILDAAQRSANLTRQLLAFARKQTVEPVALELNTAIEGTLKMLRRLIGEDIELAWFPSAGPCTIRIDPSQLDQILANLCVNARDAITDVGKISIRVDTAAFDEISCSAHAECMPGDYARLSISDDGCGMDRETQKHVFEPFFTTKAIGQGTGLGLATVYGIVKQNDGFIVISSEPGTGTTFDIYLPRQAAGAENETDATTDAAIPRSRGETVLVIEDDRTLREMGRLMLARLGYNVLLAATPGEAIRLVEEGKTDIQLFITDVVMPEMNGRELAYRLLAIRPHMRHLFMSGYPADVIAHRGVLDAEVNFIQKPFSLTDLAEKIRAALA